MQPPSDYKTAGVLMLVAGILNLLTAIGLILSLIMICVGVFWVIPLVFAIFEIITGIAALQGQPKANARTISILGMVAAVCCFQVIGLVLEIIAFVNLGKPEVREYITAV
jgi:hypothetical protein